VARLIQVVLLAAGAVLLALMVQRIGAGQLVEDLRRVGLGLVVVIVLELAVDTCNTLGWRRTLSLPVPLGFWSLFWVRQAGTAVNQLTPTATVGGEVVKAMLLRPHLATVDAAASLIVARMTFTAAQAALVALGLVIALQRMRDTPELAAALVVVAVLLGAGTAVFVALQRRGMFATLARGSGRLGVHGPLIARLYAGGTALDQRLGDLYRRHPHALAASVAWHLVAQMLGVIQLLFIVRSLGVPASFPTCLAINACALVIDAAAFLVPGRVGIQEGGRVLVFTALGFSAATGLAAAIVFRLNQLAVSALGLAALAYFSLTSAGGTVSLSTAAHVGSREPAASSHPTRTA